MPVRDRAVFVESATTHAVTPGERADYWSEVINSYHCRLGYTFPRRSNFDGRTTVRRTANYQLVGWESDAVTYYRTAGHARVDSDDDYRLLLPINGHMGLWQAGDYARLPPGVGCLVTIDKPFAFALDEATKGMLMTIPRREVAARLDRGARPVQPTDLTSGLGRVVADLASGLFAEGAVLTQHQFDTAAARLVELLCMHIVGEQPTGPSHLADLEIAVRHYVRTHADDPELTGATIARALGWSLRQIQLTLQHADTTLREIIKEERLQLAYSRLSSPVYRDWSIAALGLSLGFGSASAFSTAFRLRFGVSPRDIRHR
ncbi:helix-turn-helix domain-containing protein [Nocardia australiensis]|uniref:AraC-like ligand-binding domain-containing protein n=1 Tax=Nocardia australiensis TaxID=2887191 RepID=UPI001D142FDE|nr:helix-turn-helix domain-containing protein [Nocardia australiensis]